MTALSALRTKVRNRYGLSTDDQNMTDTILTAFINQGLDNIAASHNWDWLEATTTFATAADQSTYSLPADWIATRYIAIDEVLLQQEPVHAMLRYQDRNSSSPSFWAIEGQQIRLSPTPSAVVTVDHGYIKSEADLSADGDEPELPSVYDDLVVTQTCVLIADRLNNTQAKVRWESEFAKSQQRILHRARGSMGTMRIKTRTDLHV